MTGALVTALSLAGIGLIVLGERMGLPVSAASNGVLIVVAVATLALGFSMTTSRLRMFAAGRSVGGAVGACAMMSIALLSAAGGFRPMSISAALAGALGVVAGLYLAPLSPWRYFGADHAAAVSSPDSGKGTSGALDVVSIAGSLAALIVALRLAPALFELIARALSLPSGDAVIIVLCLAVIPIILGGVRAQVSLAVFFLVTCLALLVLPVLAAFPPPADGFALFGMREKVAFLLSDVVQGVISYRVARQDVLVGAAGFAIGFALLPVAAPVHDRAKRMAAFFFGVIIAAGIATSFFAAGFQLEQMVDARIRALPPAQWPLFVFEDGVRGWLSTCGRVSEDPFAAARACGNVTVRASLPPGSIQFNPSLAPQASASALGLPVTFGTIWALLPVFASAWTLGILLHAAIGCLVDRVLFRWFSPRAPRAWRLAMMRLGIVLAVLGLYWAERLVARGDSRLLDWALLALCSTMLMALIAFGLVRIVQWFCLDRFASEVVLPIEAKSQ